MKIIRIKLLIGLIIFPLANIFAQAVGDYQSANSGSWSTLASWVRWSGSAWIVPTAGQGVPSNASGIITILSTHSLTVTANATVDQVVVNAGGIIIINNGVTLTVANGAGDDITNNGTITNNGLLTTNTGSVITNNSIINNNLNVYINGTVNNNSTYNEGGVTRVGYTTSSGIFNNNSGATLTVLLKTATTGGQLVLGNSATKTGTFNNSGTLINNSPSTTIPGVYINYGTLTNSGTFTNNSGATTYNNAGTVIISPGFSLTNNGTFTNSDIVYDNGTFNNNGIYSELWSTIVGYTSNGIFNNNKGATYTIDATTGVQLWIGTSGSLITGTFNNGGTLTNNRVNTNGIVVDDGTLSNTGSIFNNGGNWHFTGPTVVFDYYGLAINPNGIINNSGTINNTRLFNIFGGGVINNNAGSTYVSSAYTAISGSTVNASFNNFGTYNENFEDFINSSGTASGLIDNKSGGNVNIAAGALLCFSTANAVLTNDAGGMVTNLGVLSGFPGLMLNVSGTSITNNGTITDEGNILNNGTFTNNATFDYYMTTGSITGSNNFVYGANGLLIYHGAIAQTTSGYEFIVSVPYVNINNSNAGGVKLHAGRTVGTQLTLTNGGLSLNSFTLTVNNPATTAIVRDGITTVGYIVSNSLDQSFTNILKWNIGTTTGDHVFPFGVDASTYIPFTFNLSAGGSSGNVQVSTYPDPGTTAATVFSNRPTIVTNLESIYDASSTSSNAANIVRRFWLITPDNDPISGGTATITFTYGSDANEAPLSGEQGNSMEAQHYTTSTNSWDYPFLPSQTSNTSLNTVSVPGVTNFSPWAITQSSNPLPIKLLSFNAACADNKVNIDWVTASETNNDYFTVEKSKNTRDWDFVLNMKGAGNSNSVLYYNASDDQPFDGVSYYRLKQTDFNGAFTFSNVLAVDCATNHPFQFVNAYYSSASNGIVVNFTASTGDSYSYTLINLAGQVLKSRAGLADAGTNELQINANGLSQGIYLVTLQNQGKVFSHKVLVN
ncbi:MAG: T9SS type A sorting domain-containing protein [Bacteroidales bacterium]|jgi:hypothetical protein